MTEEMNTHAPGISSAPDNQEVQIPHESLGLTQFSGNDNTLDQDISGQLDPTFTTDAIEIGQLKDFLERPTLIHETTLTEGTPIAIQEIKPWYLFFNNSVIKKKIDNYAFISCKLHVKIMVNSTPFLYGGVLVSYEPLLNHGYNLTTAGNKECRLVENTSCPHVWIFPQTNTGGEMELPFFYDTDWLELTSAQAMQDMGRLIIEEAVGLRTANSTTGSSCTIQYYAWATDVKLSGPTFEVALQSSALTFAYENRGAIGNALSAGMSAAKKGIDEFGKRPVSTIASAVAAVSKPLESIPGISMFAKATSIGASAVSKVASLFGWTNPPNVNNVEPVRNAPYHALSSASISVPGDVMALDPKVELCVDPRTVGLEPTDEMAIAYIAGRESYIGSTEWATTDAIGTDLFNCPVMPSHYKSNIVTNAREYAVAPAAMIARQFYYWRGDVIFRFKFIASNYHCGRVRIVWDPKSDLYGSPDNTNTSLNRVVDITGEQDVEVRIPFNQARHFLRVPEFQTDPYAFFKGGGAYSATYSEFTMNGVIHAYVLNALSSPEVASGVTMQVFVRMAENVELAVPKTTFGATFSYFAPQSGTMSLADEMPKSDQAHYSVYFGEAVRSLRSLLRRAYPTTPLVNDLGSNTTAIHQFVNYTRMVLPDQNGYDPTSAHELRNQAGTADAPGVLTVNTPFTLMVPCYKGFRGSMMWHYEPQNQTFDHTRPSLEIFRSQTGPDLSSGRLKNYSDGQVVSGNSSNVLYGEYFAATNAGNFLAPRTGQTLVSGNEIDGKTVVIPNMFNYRFDTTRVSAWQTDQNRPRTRHENVTAVMRCNPVAAGNNDAIRRTWIRRYYSAGVDFTCFYFQCVPRLYNYNNVPGQRAGS